MGSYRHIVCSVLGYHATRTRGLESLLLGLAHEINDLGAFAKFRKGYISFVIYVCLSVRPSVCLLPHGTTQLPLDGFLLNLMFEYFSKIWRRNENRAVYEICVKNMVQSNRPHRTILYVACKVHAWELRLQTPAQNTLLHGNSGYANAPQSYVYTYTARLVFTEQYTHSL